MPRSRGSQTGLSHVANSVQYSRVAADAQNTAFVVGAVVGVLAALIGYSLGVDKGFKLRLEAQQLLLHMQIEENTRHAA